MGAQPGCGTEPLGALLDLLLSCVASAMEDCSAPACRLFLATTTTVPWDQCCACGVGEGQAWVAVDKITPILNPQSGKCLGIYEASVKIGILRCAQTMDDNGDAPSTDSLNQEAMKILQDRLILTRALTLCFAYQTNPNTQQRINNDDWTIGEWDALGPQGGCVGGQLSLTLRFNDRC